MPQVTLTSEEAIEKFKPTDRGCYACDEAKFRFMPGDPGAFFKKKSVFQCISQTLRLVNSDGTATASQTASSSR